MRYLRSTYGPLIGIICDPSPETQYHDPAVELPESTWLELSELLCALGAASVRLEPGKEAASDSVDPEMSKEQTVIDDRILKRAIVGEILPEYCIYGLCTLTRLAP